MVRSHSEMAHILGLTDNPLMIVSKNTGWHLHSAFASLQRRYKYFQQRQGSKLNVSLVSQSSSRSIGKAISQMSHGDYIGFVARWWSIDFSTIISAHAYSFHVIKEEETTHLIYVNRGQRHYHTGGSKSERNADAVMVFSLENDKAEAFAIEMMNAAKSFNPRKSMSTFLNNHEDALNADLSKRLGKKEQKTGNCTLANSNIAWHFQLAADNMRESVTNDSNRLKRFSDAYTEMKSSYDVMRVKDRVEAFKYLLNDELYYGSHEAYLYNCFQVLSKFAVKDARDGANHMYSLVNSADKKTFTNLMNLVLSKHFSNHIEQYLDVRIKMMKKQNHMSIEDIQQHRASITKHLHVAKEMILGLALQKLPEERQKQIITNDIALLGYATPEIQTFFLKEDYNQYALYASNDVKKTFATYQERDAARDEMIYALNTASSRERKTSTNPFLLFTAGQKEININIKFSALYSYCSANDEEKLGKAFEDLCLTCCRERIYLFGEKYSMTTQSARWLIMKLSADDETGKVLRNLLKIEVDEVRSKVSNIVARHNGTFTDRSWENKNRSHENIATIKSNDGKLMGEEAPAEEKTVGKNP